MNALEYMDIFEHLESNVRSYSRSFPTIFQRAYNATLEDALGKPYIDFLAGAGALNYGSNNPILKQKILDYIAGDNIIHALDMATVAKADFLDAFERYILRPRHLRYKIQFTGPTGTNAVEAALKIARKVTGRQTMLAFTQAFHGMTLGAMAATANHQYRHAAGILPPGGCFMPFDGYLGDNIDTTQYLEQMIEDPGSGIDMPAAIIVETVQGEGGVNVASIQWLRNLQTICQRHHILLIVDDIQMGCGRTGEFFSFEEAGIQPDIITLSKSISGYGLPMSIVLIRPELDQWQPGEHTGTFRGNNLAFVAGATAIQHYWSNNHFSTTIQRKAQYLRESLIQMIAEPISASPIKIRGRGMIQALHCPQDGLAQAVCREAFDRGLIIETSGSRNHVIKCMPPLTITESELDSGLNRLADSLHACLARK